MKLLPTLRTALNALRRNMLRAVLTALGIIIGISAVIVMMSIGQGSSKAIQQTISSMGATNILIMPGTAASGGVSFGAGSIMTLTAEDSDAIGREAPAVLNSAPIVRARSQVVHGNRNWVPQTIQGTTPAFLKVRDWTNLAEGEMFTDRDVRNGNRICVIGQTIVRELFQGESPLGQEIRIQNVSFRVVGVLTSKGANMMGSDQDDVILAPWTTIKYRVSGSSSSASGGAASSSATESKSVDNDALYPSTGPSLYPSQTEANTVLSRRLENVDQLLVAARTPEQIPDAIEQATKILRDRHRIRSGEPEDFTIRNMAEMSDALTSTSKLMTRLLLGVAFISLVVGGVGIMNIMLVSVTERTREIGLRMAVGARAKDILQQFLVEAVVLCLSGGIVGIALGGLLSYAITALLKWPVEFSFPAVAAAFLVSVTVGLVFGYYPAGKAARLDPIEALRYE